MNRVLPYLITLTLGLWLGGLVALILFVSALFVKARQQAFEMAPVMFNVFETYQLILAAVALLLLVLWRLVGRSKFKTLALASVMLATLLAGLQIGVVTPKINASRNTDRPTFDRYHSLSTKNYTVITAFVLAGLMITVREVRRETTPAIAPA